MRRTKPSGGSTPKHAVLLFCRQCVGEERGKKENCQGDEISCPFYRFRLGKGRPTVVHIRRQCLICMNGSKKEVADCETVDCSLWTYRLGNNPIRTGVGGGRRE